MVLNHADGPAHENMLHLNSSSIDAWFSRVCSAKRDTPIGYQGALGAMDITRAKNCSAMYENVEVKDPNDGNSIFERTFHRCNKARDECFCELKKNCPFSNK